MKLSLLLPVAVLMLSGCNPASSNVTTSYQMSAGLQGCKVFSLTDWKLDEIIVVRCPNSEVTTNYWSDSEKTTKSSYSQ